MRIQNDRFGFYPTFYTCSENRFGVSNSLLELLDTCGNREIDDRAMSVFFRLGFFIGDDTPFKGIRALGPCSSITWEDGKFDISRQEFSISGGLYPRDRAAAIEEYGSLFRSVMGRYLCEDEDRVALPLSGGKDSRHILFALMSHNHPPDTCVTSGSLYPKPYNDLLIAKEISSLFGLEHLTTKSNGSFVQADRRKNILTNFCSDEHTWLLGVSDCIDSENFTLIYDGIGGDVLSDAHFHTKLEKSELFDAGRYREVAQALLGDERKITLGLPPGLQARWSRRLALDHLEAELIKYRDLNNPLGLFYFWNRTRREISLSPWGLLNRTCHVYAPFLDWEIYDLLSSFPPAFFRGQTFSSEVIRTCYPQWQHLPFETEMKKRGGSWRRRAERFSILRDGTRHGLAHPAHSTRGGWLRSILTRTAKSYVSPRIRIRLLKQAIYLDQLMELTDDLGV